MPKKKNKTKSQQRGPNVKAYFYFESVKIFLCDFLFKILLLMYPKQIMYFELHRMYLVFQFPLISKPIKLWFFM